MSAWARGLLLLALSALLSACFEANLKLEVTPGGSVIQTLTLTEPQGQPQSRELLADFVKQLQAQGWQVRLEGNKTIATRRIAHADGTTLGTNAFLEERFNLTRTGWWLLENYRLDVRLGQPNPVLASLIPAAPIFSLFASSLLPRLSLSLQTPFTASQHNADGQEGRTYTWQVRLDQANNFYVEYRVVRWDRLLLLVLGGALLLISARFLQRLWRP
ncbi:hypothetical protein [Meiothermus sp.]|uniref:hypothetical protein n=1 Tax=Meiothermus sp. TaxID=1955249 RepID=UPI00307FC00C